MSTLTIRLPDDKHACLRQLAKHRDISVDKFIEEPATTSIAEFDADPASAHSSPAGPSQMATQYSIVSVPRFQRQRNLPTAQTPLRETGSFPEWTAGFISPKGQTMPANLTSP